MEANQSMLTIKGEQFRAYSIEEGGWRSSALSPNTDGL